MSFSEPTIHDVQSIKAEARTDPNWAHAVLILSFTQLHRFDGDSTCPARLEIYASKQEIDAFQRIAEAINAAYAAPTQAVAAE